MDCNARMRGWGHYNPKERITQAERQKRIAWMHRETFLDDTEYQKHLEKNTDS